MGLWFALMIDAKIWIGEEAEYEQEGKKLFVDGASYDEIKEALKDYPEVNEIHFAHDKNWGFIDKLIEFCGRVEVILRVPDWVDRAKIRNNRTIMVTDFASAPDATEWDGKKVYKDDTVLVSHD